MGMCFIMWSLFAKLCDSTHEPCVKRIFVRYFFTFVWPRHCRYNISHTISGRCCVFPCLLLHKRFFTLVYSRNVQYTQEISGVIPCMALRLYRTLHIYWISNENNSNTCCFHITRQLLLVVLGALEHTMLVTIIEQIEQIMPCIHWGFSSTLYWSTGLITFALL